MRAPSYSSRWGAPSTRSASTSPMKSSQVSFDRLVSVIDDVTGKVCAAASRGVADVDVDLVGMHAHVSRAVGGLGPG